MAKVKPKTKPADPLLYIKNRLRGSRTPEKVVSQLRNTLGISKAQQLIEWLPSLRWRGRALVGGQYPRQTSEFQTGILLESVPLDAEVRWAIATFLCHRDKINKFVDFTSDYGVQLLAGDFAQCTEILDAVEGEFGLSLWSIEQRLALLQSYKGLEQQKSYLATLLKEQPNNIVRYIVHRLSQRNEEVVTLDSFGRSARDQLESLNDPALAAYIFFHTLDTWDADPTEVANLMRYESIASIIDYYETFVWLCGRCVASNVDSLKNSFADLPLLASSIRDRRLRRFDFLRTADEALLEGEDICSLAGANALGREDFDAAERMALSEVTLQPDDLSAVVTLELARLAGGHSPEPDGSTLGGRLRDKIFSVFQHGMQSRAAASDLMKLGINFRRCNFAPALVGTVWGEMDCDPVISRDLLILGAISGRKIDINLLTALPEGAAKATFARWLLRRQKIGPALARLFYRANIKEVLDDVSTTWLAENAPHYATEAQLERALRSSEYEYALTLCASLERSTYKHQQQVAVRAHAFSLLKLGRTEEAIQFVVSRILEDEHLADLLPITWCVECLDKQKRRELASSLTTPIILHMYCQYVGGDRTNIRNYAYEDFLIAHNVARPSLLLDKADEFDRTQLIYYLAQVCTPDVMLVSTEYSGTRDLDEERVAICTLLTLLDETNAEKYETEVREITRSIIVQQAVRDVEQSKIFVDEGQIRRWAEKAHNENFLRYRMLSASSPRAGATAVVDAFLDLLSGSNPQKALLEVPADEAGTLLTRTVGAILREASQNDQHGLDCFVSMRIRHGALSGQLRGPLESERIITQRLADAGPYQPNSYWLAHLPNIDAITRHRIVERLGRFSREYDDFVDRITNDLIQIRSADKPKGMFNPRVSLVDIRLLGETSAESGSFDNFVDGCLKMFWQAIDENLAEIRAAIDTTLKLEQTALFEALERDVAELVGSDLLLLGELDGAIRTSEHRARAALDEAKEWFRLPKPLQEPELKVEDLVEIGLRCVTRLHRTFDPIVEENVTDVPPLAGALIPFSDIFFIIFDNIRRHAGVHGRPRVKIQAKMEGGRLHIRVWNQLASTVRTPLVEKKLNEIRERIRTGNLTAFVRSEGGSGFGKLWKILGPGGSLDFDFDADGGFFVDFTVRAVTFDHEAPE